MADEKSLPTVNEQQNTTGKSHRFVGKISTLLLSLFASKLVNYQ